MDINANRPQDALMTNQAAGQPYLSSSNQSENDMSNMDAQMQARIQRIKRQKQEMEYVCCFGKTKILSWVIFINCVFIFILFLTLVDIGMVMFLYSFKNILISIISCICAIRACMYFTDSVWRDRNNSILRG